MLTISGKYSNGEVRFSDTKELLPESSEVLITFLESELNENSFWELISLLNWNAEKITEVTFPLIERLSLLPVKIIQDFSEILSEKLHFLDTEAHASNIGEHSYGKTLFSPDLFLYARSLVVSKGKDVYYKILQSPELMPKDADFEPLLYAASRAYSVKTGEKWKYIPKYNPETFFNRDGWKNGPDGLDLLLGR